MSKQNRALKVIDKNSLPKVLDILEVPKKREWRSANETKKSELSNTSDGSSPVSSRKRQGKLLATSKTPKTNNLGRNRNVTTRRGRGRPPKPKPISSAQRNRRTLGSNILTPYGAQMARLQNRRTIGMSFTPSLTRRPNILRRYHNLKPIACRLYDQHSKQRQILDPSQILLGSSEKSASSERKGTINSTTSRTRTTNVSKKNSPIDSSDGKIITTKTGRNKKSSNIEIDNSNKKESENTADDMNCNSGDELSLNSTKERIFMTKTSPQDDCNDNEAINRNEKEREKNTDDMNCDSGDELSLNSTRGEIAMIKRRPQENSNDNEADNHSEKENKSTVDNMNCNSSDELSLNSSSSSSLFEWSPQKSSLMCTINPLKQDESIALSRKDDNGLTYDTENRHKFAGKFRNSQTNPEISLELDSATNNNSKKFSTTVMDATDRRDIDVTNDSHDTPISATASATIDDYEIFDLVMGSKSNEAKDDDIMGSTIGDSRFIQKNIEEDSILTIFSPTDDLKTASASPRKIEQEVFRTPVHASRDQISIGSSLSFSRENIKQHNFSPKIYHQPSEWQEEKRFEAWSIHGHSGSPFFFEIDRKKYGHPPLPPGWTMRISRNEKLPIYTHPDHGRTWHCPIKLTPNMMYVKTESGKFVKQSKSNLAESAPKLYLKSAKGNIILPRNARMTRPTPQTPPITRDEFSPQHERIPSLTHTKETAAIYYHLPQQEEEDSTSLLMKDIARLSAGLMKNSSSNLYKVKKVKAMHDDTRNLTKEVFSTGKKVWMKQQQRLLVSPQDPKPQKLSTVTGLLNQDDQTRRSSFEKLDFNEQSTSISFDDHESEPPSTMSGILRQYEQTLCSGGSNTAFLDLHSNFSRRQDIADRTPSTTMIPFRSGKHLSPIRESMVRSNVEYRVKNINCERRGRGDILCDTTGTKMRAESKEINHNLSSKTSHQNCNSSLLYRVATSEIEKKTPNQPRGNVSSKLNPLKAPLSGDRKPTPNLQYLKKSKYMEHIEAWFTPSVRIKKITRSIVDNISQIEDNDDIVLRFGIKKKKSSLSRLHSTEEILKNEGFKATTSIRVNSQLPTFKSKSRSVKQTSIICDDEWSPLVQKHALDNINPKQREKDRCISDVPIRDNYKSFDDTHRHENPCTKTFRLKGVKSIDHNEDIKQSIGIPKEIYCRNQKKSESEGSNDGASTDSSLYSAQMITDQCSSKDQNQDETILAVQETKQLLKFKKRNDATTGSKNKKRTSSDTEPYLDDSFENAMDASSTAISTQRDSNLFSDINDHEKDSKTNDNAVTIVEVAVHAHAKKSSSASTTKMFDYEPLKRREEFDDYDSSASTEDRNAITDDKNDTRGVTAHPQDLKPNNMAGYGIKADFVDENESTSSQEMCHSLKKASTATDYDNNTTNLSSKKITKLNIDSRSTTEFADETSISDIGTSHDSIITKSDGESILQTLQNSEDGSTHVLGTYDETKSSIGSVAFENDDSEDFQNLPVQISFQLNGICANNRNTQRSKGTPSSGSTSADEFSSPLKANFRNCIGYTGSRTESIIDSPVLCTKNRNEHGRESTRSSRAASEAETLMESPVQPDTFDMYESYRSPQTPVQSTTFKRKDFYPSPRIERKNDTRLNIRSSQPISSTLHKQSRMSWRVLNPPHPICSLQRLEELILQENRCKPQAKRSKRGRQNKNKKYYPKRSRKSKSYARC